MLPRLRVGLLDPVAFGHRVRLASNPNRKGLLI